MTRRVLIAGCGYVGEALALRLAARGDEAFGLRRDPSRLDARLETLEADVTSPSTLGGLPRVDALVYAVSPGRRSEEAYRAGYLHGVTNLLAALEAGPGLPERVVFVSSTAVYAQDDDGWVDEDSEAAPARATAKIILVAEEAAARAPGAKVIRLSGIYGPGRTHLIRTVDAGQALARDVYTNRVHRDDAARAIELLLGTSDPRRLFIGTDDTPARLSEVREFISELLTRARGTAPPPPGTAPGSARRGSASKRLSNARLRSLGFSPEFPSFREGYPAIVQNYVDSVG